MRIRLRGALQSRSLALLVPSMLTGQERVGVFVLA